MASLWHACHKHLFVSLKILKSSPSLLYSLAQRNIDKQVSKYAYPMMTVLSGNITLVESRDSGWEKEKGAAVLCGFLELLCVGNLEPRST